MLDDGTGGELAPVAGVPFLLQILGTFLSTGDRIRIVEDGAPCGATSTAHLRGPLKTNGDTKPRNPRHFGTIEGGRNSSSGGRTTKTLGVSRTHYEFSTNHLKNCVRHLLPRFSRLQWKMVTGLGHSRAGTSARWQFWPNVTFQQTAIAKKEKYL